MIVVWRVTERCDLACPFCTYDRRLKRSRRTADPDVVTHLGEVLAEYRRRTGDPVLVSWLGGEPLRWPPLRALTERFVDLGLAVSATTNGTALRDADVRAHVVARYAELTVSIDAVGAAHDRLRGRAGLFVELRAAVGALARARNDTGHGPLLRANIVLQHGVAATLPSLCNELAGWGLDEVTLNQLGGNDRPDYWREHRLRPADSDWLAEHLPGLRAELAAGGVRLAGGAAYLRRIAASVAGERVPIVDCEPGTQVLFVDEAGTVAPCGFTAATYGVPAAELVSADDLVALPARFAQRRRQRAPACDDCHSTHMFEKFGEAPAWTGKAPSSRR